MQNEFSNDVLENKNVSENNIANENNVQSENVFAKEYIVYEENNETSTYNQGINKNKKDKAFGSMSVTLVSTIAAVTLGITTLLNVSMDASFNKVEFVDGIINYEVSVENMTEKESLAVHLYENGKLLNDYELIDEDGDGLISGNIEIGEKTIDNVKDKQSYRLSLTGNVGLNVERKFDSYLVEIENLSSSFESITGECHCSEDGCYHFFMNYKDDLNIYSNFEAYIEDVLGNKSYCIFTDDLHGEQKIFVSNLKGSSGTLVLTFMAEDKLQTIKIDITM